MFKEKTLKISLDAHKRLKLLSTHSGISMKSYLDKITKLLYDELMGIDTIPLSEGEKEDLKLSEEDIKTNRIQTLEEVIEELENAR